ncbi:DUF6712 family protein [Kaistella sp.]|uniref:DUF6712 family protein n=1 Tax=Kaistella sp. TaxID=2782235 RepID=UPI002F952711
MKILFDKEQTDSSEILDVLGFTDADIALKNVWPYLRTASKEIYNIIGKTNYDLAATEYENEMEPDSDSEVVELLELVRYAVALDAMRKYAPLIDVSITNDGRLFRRDEHQVAAFPWQIENSNRDMEKSYYAAVDALITFIVDSDELEESEYMQQFSGLYVPNLKTFQQYVNINDSHLLYLKLAPSLRLCEQREIMNRMGAKFTEYKAKEMKDSYITGLVQNCCVYYAMADGVQKLSVQLFPDGLSKNISESTSRIKGNGYDKESVTLFYQNKLESLLKSLEMEMRKLQPVYTSKPKINFDCGDGFVTTS